MTEQEKINVDIQRQIDAQGARIDKLADKIDAFVEESRATRERQDAEIRELRQKHDADMKEINQRFYAKFDEMDAKIDNIGNNVRSLTITAMIGVGTSVIAVVVMVGTMAYAILSR